VSVCVCVRVGAWAQGSGRRTRSVSSQRIFLPSCAPRPRARSARVSTTHTSARDTRTPTRKKTRHATHVQAVRLDVLPQARHHLVAARLGGAHEGGHGRGERLQREAAMLALLRRRLRILVLRIRVVAAAGRVKREGASRQHVRDAVRGCGVCACVRSGAAVGRRRAPAARARVQRNTGLRCARMRVCPARAGGAAPAGGASHGGRHQERLHLRRSRHARAPPRQRAARERGDRNACPLARALFAATPRHAPALG
jgi:hypothetical protein